MPIWSLPWRHVTRYRSKYTVCLFKPDLTKGHWVYRLNGLGGGGAICANWWASWAGTDGRTYLLLTFTTFYPCKRERDKEKEIKLFGVAKGKGHFLFVFVVSFRSFLCRFNFFRSEKAICRHSRKEPPKDFCFFFFLFCYYFLGNNKGPGTGRAAGAGYVLFWSQMSLYLDGIYRLICEERAANLSINKPQHCRRPIFSLSWSLYLGIHWRILVSVIDLLRRASIGAGFEHNDNRVE